MDNTLVSVIAAIIAIPIILVGYLLLSEWLVARLPRRWQSRARPYLWILPAVGFATVFMVIPTINTIWLSFLDRKSEAFVGLANYQYFFTNPGTLGSIKNSLLWLVFFTGGVVIGGLLIAVMFDRVRYESWAKLAVFLPLPISAVAASIIWKFMFEYQPAGQVQTGTLNALIGVVGRARMPVLILRRSGPRTRRLVMAVVIVPVLGVLAELPRAVAATDAEVLAFIGRHALAGSGIGYLDAHLLAATRLTPDALLWTRDRRLAAAARHLSLAAMEA